MEQSVSQDGGGGGGEMTPVPMVLHCPQCHQGHVDENATRPHKTHRCVAGPDGPGCGHEWRPALTPTVGVADTHPEESDSRGWHGVRLREYAESFWMTREASITLRPTLGATIVVRVRSVAYPTEGYLPPRIDFSGTIDAGYWPQVREAADRALLAFGQPWPA